MGSEASEGRRKVATALALPAARGGLALPIARTPPALTACPWPTSAADTGVAARLLAAYPSMGPAALSPSVLNGWVQSAAGAAEAGAAAVVARTPCVGEALASLGWTSTWRWT